jgi:ADP-heptose:LPS heptosyltransferase
LKKILIIQTAFIGDVILATAVAEKLHSFFPDAQIDFLLRGGNETLLSNHPFIKQVFVWDKRKNKVANLFKQISLVRNHQYDLCLNLQRFFSSGLVTVLSAAKEKRGFEKNPISFLFDKRYVHEIGTGKHEVERNLLMIEDLTDSKICLPKLYPSAADFESVKQYQAQSYVCMAPASVWFTKQLPESKWVELIMKTGGKKIFLLGAKGDSAMCERISKQCPEKQIENLCGKLSFLQSAALMKGALMNYVNDSAPLHLCSAVNAPVTAFFCSTIPEFGFGPLAENSIVVQTQEKLSCRPCGLHGYKECPLGHFRCATGIDL